jgi:flagellar biosynthesis/type III secretory pathway protein FliH
MRNINIKKMLAVSVFAIVAILGMSDVASAQWYGRDQREQERVYRQQQRQQERLNRQRQQSYRVYRNGSYYNTDNRGAELLRQAVNRGYQQGVIAGRNDRMGRRGMSWRNSRVYSSGNYGYQSYVDSSQYRYYFQQGFERGYQDGYNSRYQYGSNNNGTFNILGSILSSILNIRSY